VFLGPEIGQQWEGKRSGLSGWGEKLGTARSVHAAQKRRLGTE
jgi:hypothetical protein